MAGCSQYNVSVHHALLHLEAVAIVVFAYVLHVMRVTTTYMGSAALAETHALLVLQQLTIPVFLLNRLNILTTEILFHVVSSLIMWQDTWTRIFCGDMQEH